MSMYIVQFNDGRTMVVPSGEAKMWALLSWELISCNVYHFSGGSTVNLYVTDIR